MEELTNLLAIIGLIEFLKRSYAYFKDKENFQKIKYYYYHKESPKILITYIFILGVLVVWTNFLIYNLILFSYQLSIIGMYIGMIAFLLFTIIPMLLLSKLYNNHIKDMQLYGI